MHGCGVRFLLFMSDCGQDLMPPSLELWSELSTCNWIYIDVLKY